MIKLGSMVFCKKHFKEHFGNEKVDSESEIFKFWREKYIEKINKEYF